MQNSKLIVSAAIAISAIAGIGMVSAADLPARTYSKAPAIVASPVYDWSGFYVGADVGYGWGRSVGNATNAANTPGLNVPYSVDTNGVIGGGFLGYNYQINQLVLGVEADWQYMDRTSTSAPGASIAFPGLFYTATTNLKDYGSVRGRVGYAADRWMIFATGGAAWGSWSTAYASPPGSPPFYTNNVSGKWGWTAGAGVEYAVTNNWLLRAEYRYTDLGTSAFIAGSNFAAPNAQDTGNRVTINDVRFGVAYKFGGPVVAKY